MDFGGHSFSFSTLSTPFYSILAFMVSDTKPAVSLIKDPLYVMSSAPVAA